MVVVERVLFQVNARTAMAVGQASGLALAAAARAGCPVAQYSPNEVKLAVAGYGVGDQRAGPAHGAGPARPGPSHPGRRTGPTPWPWPSATCRGPGCALPAGRQPASRGAGRDRFAAGGGPGPGRPGRARPARCCSRWAGSATGCWCPAGALGQIGAPGSPAFLHVHTHVREDAIVLYGFPSRDERACFEALIGAHGVGPAVALALLSVHSPAALQRAVLADDTDALMLVPGIGKKTATRLLIELKARLDIDLDGADLQLVASARPGRPGRARPGGRGPGPKCAPPCPGSATGPTRSASPRPPARAEGDAGGSDPPGPAASWRELGEPA